MFDRLAGPYPRAGPRAVIATGCLLMAGGWGWLSRAAAAGGDAPYAAIAAAAALGGFGATFLDTAALALAVANHPAHRGTAVGVTKAGLGLSGACWATAWTAAAGGGGSSGLPVASLLRGLAVLPPAVALVACAGVNRVPFIQADEAAAAAAERAGRARRARPRRRRGGAPSPPPGPRPRPPAPPAARFATAGHAILAIAAYETAAALALRGGGAAAAAPPPLDPAARGLLVAGLVGLIATLGAVPLGPGGGLWAVRSGAAPARPLDCVVGDGDGDGEGEGEGEGGEEAGEEERGGSESDASTAARPPLSSSGDEEEAGRAAPLLHRPSLPPAPWSAPLAPTPPRPPSPARPLAPWPSSALRAWARA